MAKKSEVPIPCARVGCNNQATRALSHMGVFHYLTPVCDDCAEQECKEMAMSLDEDTIPLKDWDWYISLVENIEVGKARNADEREAIIVKRAKESLKRMR